MTMASIKLELPQAMIAISHDGTVYAPAADGTVSVPEAAVAALIPHGLTPKPPPATTMAPAAAKRKSKD